jgi:HSP20 family protein
MWFDDHFDRMFQRLSDRFFDMDDDFERAWRDAKTVPYFYGYSITIGSDGRPIVKQYGNVLPTLATTEAREPFVDQVVDKDNKNLRLLAEMPGVDKNDIKVTVEGKYANISAEHGDRRYHSRVQLRHKVDENSAKATYANGILEVTFRLVDEKPKGKTIPVN